MHVDHQKLQERLGGIVRAKEGKMVNVSSQIPFNLHNQAIPPEVLRGHHSSSYGHYGYGGSVSNSRSTSVSRYTPQPQYRGYYDRGYGTTSASGGGSGGGGGYGHLHPRYYDSPRALSMSPTRSSSQHPGLQPQQQHTLVPRPSPILNVRLVKFQPKHKDPAGERGDKGGRRGRSRERRKLPSGLGVTLPGTNEDVSASASASEGEEEEVMTPQPHGEGPDGFGKKQVPLQLKDLGAIALSWGD
ncbi:hypothetical protein BDQ17DRAFT_1425919 [Cyathus striatus]|nr:hypothetical protein BDQ17DRAFT_1425919 [Cyathus striatus]